MATAVRSSASRTCSALTRVASAPPEAASAPPPVAPAMRAPTRGHSRMADARPQRRTVDSFADEVFRSMLGAADYVAVRSILRQGGIETHGYPLLGSVTSAGMLLAHLRRFTGTAEAAGLTSLVAVFLYDTRCDEQQFGALLRRQLQAVRDLDDPAAALDPATDPAADLAGAESGFCAAGGTFDIIGLHPAAARAARRAPLPMIVFNRCAPFPVPVPARATAPRRPAAP